MKNNKTHRSKINRKLTTTEKELIKNLLSHLPNPKPYIEQLGQVQVVGQCDCGCPTIDLRFIDRKTKSTEIPEILIEAEGRSPEGIPVGIILWTKDGYISELEIYPLEDTGKFGLPDIKTLTNYGNRNENI